VIEDSERLAAGLKEGLTASGFAVDVAFNGVDGLWMAQENPYDAVVLDIMLPGMARSPTPRSETRRATTRSR
jgi:DNA-binding response OmpR family regulator